MPRVKEHPTYKWYASFRDKTELHLPDMEVEKGEEMVGTCRIYCYEIFCRAPNCPKEDPQTSLNNLRKHYKRKHTDITLKTAKAGGRPTLEEEQMAINFYIKLRNEYEERQVKSRSTVPLRRDGTIHLTNARRIVRQAGGQIPCEPCKDADDAKGCCHLENINRCDNFEYFTDVPIRELEENEEIKVEEIK